MKKFLISMLCVFCLARPVWADANSDLITAAKSGNLAGVVAALNAGADVNFQDKKYGETALMWAARDDNSDIVDKLLKAGANVNLQDEDGETALMEAAYDDNFPMVSTLLSWAPKLICKIMMVRPH